MITLLIFTHGRDLCLKQTLESFADNVKGPITDVVINDDSPEPRDLSIFEYFPRETTVTYLRSGGVGFGRAINKTWNFVKGNIHRPFIFHLEDDFTFNEEIDLWQMMGILDYNPNLVQLALMRQPYNDVEMAAGSLYELHRDSFESVTNTYLYPGGFHLPIEGQDKWVEHDMWFTTNPSLYRRELVQEFEWPICDHSEGFMSFELVRKGFKFGYLGTTEDPPKVTHIGNDRMGGIGY